MTRAQQTVSLGLLVSSVTCPPLHTFSAKHGAFLAYNARLQVYLAFLLQLVPLSVKIQDDILPVVWLSSDTHCYKASR